jgi:hypothetical protein
MSNISIFHMTPSWCFVDIWLSHCDLSKPWIGLDLQFSTRDREMFFASTLVTVRERNTARFWTNR